MVENKHGWSVGDKLTWTTKKGLKIFGEVAKVTKVMIEFETEDGKTIRMKGDSSEISHGTWIPVPTVRYDPVLDARDPEEPDPDVIDGYQTFWVVVEMKDGSVVDIFVKTPTAIKGASETSEVYPCIRAGLGDVYGKEWVRISSVLPGYSLCGKTNDMPVLTVRPTSWV